MIIFIAATNQRGQILGTSHVLRLLNGSQLLIAIPIRSILALGRSSDRRVVLIAVPIGVRIGRHFGTARSWPLTR